jgi:type IV pilus assembly protein PilE
MRGFTLIEVMIVCAIIAILAAIAVPSYLDSVWKGKRGEAKAAILKALQAEERYYSQNNTYLCYPGGAPCTSTPDASFPQFSADSLTNSVYTIAVVAAPRAGMCTDNNITKCAIVVATVRGIPDPKCGTTLLMDTVGNKSSAVIDPICWK